MTFQQIQLRRGTNSQWVALNPVLSPGEPAYADDIGVLKVGDGFTHYIDLPEIGASQLGQLAPGQVISVLWNGTNWLYGGNIVIARPTNRSDITCLFLDNIGTGTAPTFSQPGDLFVQRTVG